MSDKEIVDLYLSRDEEAIRKTEMKYGSYLMKIAVNILGDPEEAKEVVNETYLAAWNSIPVNSGKTEWPFRSNGAAIPK